MRRIKKNYAIALTIIFALMVLASGCAEEAEPLDEAKLEILDSYTIEMSPALLDVVPDLEGWVRKPYSDNLPLVYDQERVEWLQEHAEKITGIRTRNLDRGLPAYNEIADWEIVVVRGEQEWLLNGPGLAAALEDFDRVVYETVALIELIAEEDGELNMAQSDRVLELIERLEPVVDNLRAVQFRM